MISKKVALTTGLSLLALITTVTGVASVTSYAYQHRVSPRTIVAGVPIGGLTNQEATQLVLEKEAELNAAQLSVQYLDQSKTIPLTELGVTIVGPEQSTPEVDTNIWSWLKPRYWQRFLSEKKIGMRYDIDTAVAQRKLEAVFNVQTTAREAVVTTVNGELTVQPSTSGESLGLSSVLNSVEQLLAFGTALPATVAVESVEPIIDTDAATQTKTEIEQVLRPVYLVADNKTYTIPKSDLYSLIDYTASNNTLKWQLSDEKLSAYLANKVAARINVKMVQKLIQSDTQEVTQQGRDGKIIDSVTLVSAVKRTIAEQVDTKQQPLVIPVQTVSFTEKIVPPEYVAGLFEGLYIDINLTKQKMFIMNGQTKTGQFLVSTGKRGTATPVGLFYVKNKIELAQSRLYPGIWMRNWNALAKNPDGSGYEGYGIHDLPAFNKEYTIVEGASHLGRPVSHGCVRLGHEPSIWFYQNVPVGTPVNIHY